MGKKKAKRVKKAWRSISTADIDEFTEKSAKDALSGGSVSSLPSDSLFFVDTSTDAPLKRKIEKHREKMLRCDSILQKNPFVQAVPSSVQKKSKRVQQASALEQQEQLGSSTKEDAGKEAGLFDIWDDQGGSDVKSKKPKAKPSLIPAVEAEPPGCSYNPDDESHKDSLARAVAEEMKKVYRSELGPQPVPLTVPGEAIGEEDRYFLDVDDEGEHDMDEENQSENGDDALGKRTVKEKRVTRVEQNRRVRHKEQMRAELEAKKAEQLSKEIDSIDDIIQEIDQEDEEKQKRHLRRVVAKQERLKSCPPRLGKRKFEPAPLQVLLSEEITGSLRKLKACCTLARDRFKSLEKRGLIVPSAKSSRR